MLITCLGSMTIYIVLNFLQLSMVTHVLAEIFTSLYKQGFGCTVEYQEDDGDKTQDATGTGVGEGAGAKDVSEQIEDEDHLLGTEKVFDWGPSCFLSIGLNMDLILIFFNVFREKN